MNVTSVETWMNFNQVLQTEDSPYERLLESILEFAYTGVVEVEHAAVAPLAVLAFRLGLTEFVDSCAEAIIKRCVFNL